MNQKEKSSQTILNIIDAGINEFAEQGRFVSLNGICQNHGISKGKLYHHFSSKDELICECVCYCFDNLIKVIEGFETDKSISVNENFHNYCKEKIEYWYENPNQLVVLRLSYSLRNKIFSPESMKKINEAAIHWRKAKKEKFLEIINSNNNKLRMDVESILTVLLIMYENTFQTLEDRMISEIKNNDSIATIKTAKEFLAYHDIIIDMILHGAIAD